MNVLLIDNYDSFTFNLKHCIEKVSEVEVDVYRNDCIDIDTIEKYEKIVLSPGPGIPSEAGITIDVIKRFHKTKKIIGICLGQQSIAVAFGGTLSNLKKVFHGISTPIRVLKKDLLFENIPLQFKAGRYHSWVINPDTLPNELEVIAEDEFNNIMAIRHREFDLCGVQFHPESILTEYGEQLIKNWLE